MEVPKRRRELEDMLEEWAEVEIERASGCDLEIVHLMSCLCWKSLLIEQDNVPVSILVLYLFRHHCRFSTIR